MLGRRIAVVLFGAVALLAAARPAEAHAKLVATEPAIGQVVTRLDRIVLHFEEPVTTLGAQVWLEDDGGTLSLGPAIHPAGHPTDIEVPVPAVAGGRYTVGYHVVAGDGHIGSGSYGFAFEPPGADEGAAADADPLSTPAIAALQPRAVHQQHSDDLPAGAARVLLDAALASLVGGVAFLVTAWPQGASYSGTRRLLWASAIAAAGASFALAVIQHAAAARLSLLAAIGPKHVRQSLHYPFGRVAAARLVLLIAAAVLTSRLGSRGAETLRSTRWQAAASAVAVGLFETVVFLGHNGRSSPLGETARLVHTAAVSIWLGGLVMLFAVVLPRRRAEELAAVLPRFSALATAAVGSLLVGGVALAVDLVGAARALPTTTYGRVLLLKLLVVAVLLVAASRSRDTVRRRLAVAASGRRNAVAGPLATWVGIELGLMVIVLALTALLVSQTPPA